MRRDDQATTADASNKDLVVISSTVDPPGDVGIKFRDVLVPVLLWERQLYDEMRMTADGDHGEANNRNEIDIANINHPLRGNVETGNQVVYNSNQTLNWGTPNGNAVAIASLTGGGSNQDRKVIFGYPAGAQMVGSPPFNAPARRVGFFLFDNSADNLDPRGRILFANAVIWARGN